MKSDAQIPSSSRPTVGATAAPIAETPVAETPEAPVAEAAVAETPIVETPAEETPGAEAPVAPSSTPAPMETGGVGDGQSLAEQMEASDDKSFQRSRPAKRACSQSQRHEPKSRLPFPLQNSERRLTSISQLYEHAAVQPAAPHNVAGQAIMHLHPDLLLQKATHLGNQVVCMIAEYHLTTSARQSSLRPIIPQEAAPLLPPLKNYLLGVAFKGTQDVRVVDHAMALRLAVWLHRLDMAVGGEALASETLEASWHHLGSLLESFLTPGTSNLTYQEVVDRVLTENRRASTQSLHHLQGRRTHNWEVLDGLIKVHGELDKEDKATQKSLKKIDQRHKSLEMLKERISHYEAQLGQEPSEGNAPGDDSQVSYGAQAELALALAPADDAPSESTMTPVTPASDPPPAEDQSQDMEVDDYAARPSLPSPVSREDDDLLLGLSQSEVTEVESGLAHLSVLSPRGPNGEGEEASH